MAEILEARVIQKVGTEAEWLAKPLVLLDGEAAIVRTGDGTPVNLKFGDGGKTFAELPYFIDYSQAAYIAYEATPTQPIAYTFVGEGTYGAITVADGYMAVLGWDGTSWSKNAEIEVPTQDISGLVTKEEFESVAPVAKMLIKGNQLLDNSTFKFGRWNEDGTIGETTNELRSDLTNIDDSKFDITFSGGGNISNGGARFVFFNESGFISFSDSNPASIPVGASKVGVTIVNSSSLGGDPVNTIYKNTAMLNYGTTALPWEEFNITLDGNYISGLTPSLIEGFNEAVEDEANEAVDQKIKPLEQGLDFLLSGYEKYTKFDGINGEVPIDQYVLNANGDYIEWISKPENDANSNQSYGLFGERGVSQRNVIGYWPLTGGVFTEITIRENQTNIAYIRFPDLGDLKSDFHKFKLLVNGSNWELYVDGVLKGTKPKSQSLVINNIGYGYGYFAKFNLKSVQIHTSTQDFISDSVELLPNATSGVTAFYENLNPTEQSLSPFYVSYTPTGIDAASNPLQGKFTVYCRREGYEDSYSGIEIWHEVDMSEIVWKDYWRIGFAEEYTLDGDQMIKTHDKVLATGESESVWKRQNTPNPKADFTGGWHGDEVMRSNAFKMLINGNEVSLSTAFDMVPANSVEYSVMSDMTEVADLIDGDTIPISGHPIDCSHYKRTTFKVGGYDTYNKMVWARPVPVMLWDFGICCFGKVQGTQGFNDSVVSSSFNLQDNSYHLSKNDGNLVNYQNTSTGLSGYVYSNMIKPTNKGDKCLMRVQDRFYDSKYYNMYQENVTTSAGEVWESIMQVRFS